MGSILTCFQDRTIIATAIPRITDDFHSLGDIGWYGSAYLLTMSATQLSFGTIFRNYSIKWVFLVAISIFEVGSAVCGAAPNSTSFIVGRAIAGLGSAGIFTGAILIILHTIPLRQRPIATGLVGAVFGIASVAGPLLGGVFTSKVSWRWCFYINLPIGAVTIAVILFLLKLPGGERTGLPVRQQLAQLDPLGFSLLVPSVVCLLLALQWGGSKYPWGNGRIVALLVLFGVLFTAFIAVQIWKKDAATVPPRIIKQRSIAAGAFFNTCVGASMMVMTYYLPLWFQALKGVSAVKSAIMSLPMILGLVVATITSGALITKTGYYTPFMIMCSVVASIGAGLITTFATDTGHAKWISYQVVYGFGLGMGKCIRRCPIMASRRANSFVGMQQSSLAAQTVLPKKDVPIGTAIMFFTLSLSGAVFVSVAQNVFTNRLVDGLRTLPNINPAMIIGTGATELKKLVPVEDIQYVLYVYNSALTKAFVVALSVTCFAVIGAAAMEWKSVKGKGVGSISKA